MMARFMGGVARLVNRWSGLIALISLVLTIFFACNVHHLRTKTDLTDLFGDRDPEWREASKIGNELGYSNQLYVVIEAPKGTEESAEFLEAAADRLIGQMTASGLFKSARSGLSQQELIQMVRLFSWNPQAYTDAQNAAAMREQFNPARIRRDLSSNAAEFITPFSALGSDYFVADPLGLMRTEAGDGRALSGFGSFDMNWGSSNRFYSADHTALLVIAEPRGPAVDYQFAERVMQWTHTHTDQIAADPAMKDAQISLVPAGAYVYSEQDHLFVERNIRRVSLVSMIGSLLLCLAVYPSVQLVVLSLLPTGLGILWTTGIASFYPGEVNLISLSFIAILAGLGDDQVVHLFNRSPQEWQQGGNLSSAIERAFRTTGVSIVICILTAACSTAALALSGFKALSEFGFILTVGMFMTLYHTLLTVPALMQLWGRFFKPVAPKSITFRFLPSVAHWLVDYVGRHARLVVAFSFALVLFSAALIPKMHFGGNSEFQAGVDTPGLAAQKLLASKFGIEGTPDLLLISGSEQEVLERAEKLTAELDHYRQSGTLKSIFSPTNLLPSARTQIERAALLSGVDWNATATALEEGLRAGGLRVEPHQAYLDRLHALASGAPPLTLESLERYLPAGLIENSIRSPHEGRYVLAIAYYARDPYATEPIPAAALNNWRSQYGPFIDFSFNKINRDVENRVLHDSQRALVLTSVAIFLIVFITFRRISDTLLVLMPIPFAVLAAFGLLHLMGHHFSMMAVTAIPLIVGIGIDNGIHLVRRYREHPSNNILDVAKASGAALIQSNLTTIVGFGALTTATFAPLAEMGIVTSLGVALTLFGGLLLIPALLCLCKITPPQSAAV